MEEVGWTSSLETSRILLVQQIPARREADAVETVLSALVQSLATMQLRMMVVTMLSLWEQVRERV